MVLDNRRFDGEFTGMSTSYVHQRYAPPHKRQSRVFAFPLLTTGLIVAAASGFILSLLWPGWPGTPVAANAPALPVTIAGAAFNIPPGAVRIPIQRQPGAHERLDLA